MKFKIRKNSGRWWIIWHATPDREIHQSCDSFADAIWEMDTLAMVMEASA